MMLTLLKQSLPQLMLPAFYKVCSELVIKWEKLVSVAGSCEIDVWPELKKLTGDAISQTAFGSSYEEGRRIFQLQTELVDLAIQAAQTLYIPGLRYTYMMLKMEMCY